MKPKYDTSYEKKGTKNAIIAERMGISVIWVKKLWARYKHIEPDQMIYPRPMGRPKKSLPSRREHSTVLSAYHNSNLATTCIKDEKDVTGMDISYCIFHTIPYTTYCEMKVYLNDNQRRVDGVNGYDMSVNSPTNYGMPTMNY